MNRKSSQTAESTVPSWAITLAKEVRRRRKALRLTQRDLAALVGCGPDFLYDLEKGKPTLRLDKLVAVLSGVGLQLRIESGSGGLVTK